MAAQSDARYAIISAGTNSCRLLIAAGREGALRPEYHETRGTRLGEGVDEARRLRPEAIERTIAAVRDYAALAKGAARTFGIGTSALRDAANAGAFAKEFAAAAGVPLQVVSGEEEAACSFEGAVCGLRASGRAVPAALTVVDVGGGSTEVASRTGDGRPPRVSSLQIGAVRLTEQYLKGDPPLEIDVERSRQAVRAALRALPDAVRSRGAVIAVGGTANTAGRMLQLMDDGSGSVCEIPRQDLALLLKATVAMPVRERVHLHGLPAQRADIFPAGLLILDELIRLADAPTLVVSQSDLLLGYIARHT